MRLQWERFLGEERSTLERLQAELIHEEPEDLIVRISPLDDRFGGQGMFVFVLQYNIGFELFHVHGITGCSLARMIRDEIAALN